MTVEEVLAHEKTRRMPEALYVLYVPPERGPTAAAMLYWRGLCPTQTSPQYVPQDTEPEYCGKPYDKRSELGHCTQHYEAQLKEAN